MYVSLRSSYDQQEHAAPRLNRRFDWNDGSKLVHLDEHTSLWALFESRGAGTLQRLRRLSGTVVQTAPREFAKSRAAGRNTQLADIAGSAGSHTAACPSAGLV